MGYTEATESLKYPFLITRDTSPSRAVLEVFKRMPGDRNLLSLDSSLAIPTRVLPFEDSGLLRSTPVRPVILTGQTGTHRLHRSDHQLDWSDFVDQPRNPVVFW
jgi:hypothetical protein